MRHHRNPPGSRPDVFLPQGCGGVPGAEGQFVTYELRGDSVGDPGAADRMGWPVDALAPYCTLDWADGDGTTIHILDAASPGLLTEVGGAVAAQGKPTPWTRSNGNAVTAARLGTTVRFTANKIGVADGADLIVIDLCRMEAAIGNNYAFKAYQGAPLRGVLEITSTNVSTLNLYGAGSVIGVPFGTAHSTGWALRGWVISRTTNLATPYVGGVAGAPVNIAALGSMAGTYALEIGSSATTARALISRLMWFEGAGIASLAGSAFWQRLAEAVHGLRPLQGGGTPTTFARATIGRCMYDATGRVFVVAANTPPCGNSLGIQAGESIANRTSRNHGFAAADAALVDADAGLTVSIVDDSANLEAVCPGEINAIRIQNTTAGTLFARINRTINTTDTSWCSIRARVVAGPIAMGWQTAAGVLTSVVAAISTGYARSAGRAAPADAGDKQALELPAGADVYIIFPCCGTLADPRLPVEVPSQENAGVSPTAVQDAYTTPLDPPDTGLSVAITSAPDGWNTGEGALVQALQIGANNFVGLEGATGEVVVTDGTRTARAVATEADGVATTVRASVGSRGIACLQSGGPPQIDAYDGALPAGALTLRGSPRRVSKIEMRRNFSLAEGGLLNIGTPTPARLALPPDLYCVQGNTLLLIKISLVLAAPAGYTWTVTAPGLVVAQDATTITLGDGTEIEADYTLTISLSVGGTVVDSATSTVHINDDLAGGDPTWDVIMAGDSLTSTGTYPDDVVTAGGGHIVAVGTQATALPTPCEGWPGATVRALACNPVVSWVDARGVIDVPAYLAALGSVPEAIVWLMGTNDCYQARVGDIEYATAQSLAYLDRLIAAFAAAVPGLVQGVAVLPPGSSSQAAFDASYPPAGTVLVADWRARQHRYAEAVIARYGSVAGRLIPVGCHVDGDTDYPAGNAVHPDAGGYARIAAAVYAWLVARMT